MKLTTLLLITVCLHVSASSFAQRVTISGKDLSLEKVFSMIKKQTGYVFFYDYSVFRDARKVSLDLHGAEVDEAIKTCLNGQDLDYNIVNKTVYVTRREERAAPVAAGDPPAKIDVRGKVLNDKGEPVPGATVKIKGSKLASASTNDQGEFILHDVEATASIVISSVGYELWEIRLKGKADLTVLLHTKISSLDETQVIAYGTTTQRFNVGSVSTVKAEDIAKQPVTNPLQALEGRVAGLVVSQTSGIPGAAIKIQIRGQNSLNPNPSNRVNPPLDNPLFIIDGVPFAPQNANINQYNNLASPGLAASPYGGVSPFNSINPSDIESIDVLKDADATAIYGSRGANGVILITTKRGKAGKTSFSAAVNTGVNMVPNTIEMMNTQQYLKIRREALKNDKITPTVSNSPDLLVFDTTKYTNWKNYFLQRSSTSTDASASMSGGTANTQFFVGTGYHHDTYIYPGDFSDNRVSFNINLHHNSNDQKLSIDFSSNYSYDQNNLSGSPKLLSAFTLAPNFPDLFKSDNSLNWNYKGVNIVNPAGYLKTTALLQTYNLVSHFQIGYQVLPHLYLRSSFGYNTLNIQENNRVPKIAQNPLLNATGSSAFGANNFQGWIIEPQLEYKRTLSIGRIDVLVGGTFQKNTNKTTSVTGNGYTNDALLGSITAANSISAVDGYSLYKYNALFGRINYVLSNKYIVNFTGRRDGSSRFGPGKQFGNFGSVGAGWIFSEESLIKERLPILSYGKIRASYGTAGNDNIGDYQYIANWTPTTLDYQGTVGYTPTNLYKPDFSWAVNKKLEAGLEFGFFKDRLLFNFSWFRNRCGNQLITYQLPIQTGFVNVTQNFNALVQNSGWEVQFSLVNIKKKDFTWTTTFNITIPKNELVSFPGLATSSYSRTYLPGKSLTALNRYRYLDVNKTTGLFEFESKNGPTSTPTTFTDYHYVGNLDPKFYGGLRNTWAYKGLQFDVFLSFGKQLGANYLQQIYTGSPAGFSGLNLPTVVSNHWSNPGDESNMQKLTSKTSGATYNAANAFANSSGVYSDASYIRVKTVSLAYTIDSKYIKKIKMEGCSIFVNAQNLFTITSYKLGDPETKSIYVLPPLKTIVAGLKFTF